MIKFMYCYLALSRKRRQPRKNVTKETAEPSTPRRPSRKGHKKVNIYDIKIDTFTIH
jgi:hypothetical protein